MNREDCQILARQFLDNCIQFAQILLPGRCALCDCSGSHPLCSACWKALPRLGPTRCRGCARPLSQPGLCGPCLRRPLSLQQIHASYHFDAPLSALIHRFKYRQRWADARLLARLMLEDVPDWPAGTLLLPIPLHPHRLRERGYNQAALLTRHLARTMQLPSSLTALQREHDTPQQQGLSRQERQRNLKGAFRVDSSQVAGRCVVLVDDVMTTGSTLDTASRALLRAGARQVEGWVLARAL